MRHHAMAVMGLAAAGWLGGCEGPSSVLDPASPEARELAWLWWVFFAVCALVFAGVLLALVGALLRGRDVHRPAVAHDPPVAPDKAGDRRATLIVAGAVGATVLILFGLLIADFRVAGQLRPPVRGDALTIKITGRQWWWQIEYMDRQPANHFTTANELHLPAGRPVQLLLESADVIHSFWLPNLQGKMDLVPGHQTSLWITPERPGVFRGQCAEFCGHQHAHMGLLAVVETAEEFARWQEAQRKPSVEPATESQKRGRDVFLTRTCAMCHEIRGTDAGSRVGPSLTHLASRQTIAAGAFPNNRGHLGGWVVDPQAMKPGARMPPNALGADELHALLDYLEILK